jgi:hypothetical protein
VVIPLHIHEESNRRDLAISSGLRIGRGSIFVWGTGTLRALQQLQSQSHARQLTYRSIKTLHFGDHREAAVGDYKT